MRKGIDHLETQSKTLWACEYPEKVEKLESQIKIKERNIEQQLQHPKNTAHLFGSSQQGDIAAFEIEKIPFCPVRLQKRTVQDDGFHNYQENDKNWKNINRKLENEEAARCGLYVKQEAI